MSTLFSPEFVSLLVGLIVSLLVAVIPQFESVKTELIAVTTVLVGLVIAAFGGERTMAAKSSGSTAAERLSAKSESLKVPTVKSP